MFTEERISEILAVCEKATPEWKAGNFKRCIVTDAIDGSVFGDDSNREYYGGSLVAESIHPANRDFAILARTALPQLAEDYRKLLVVAEAARVACEELEGHGLYAINRLREALTAAGYGGED